jgi:hypothetical protein
MLGLTCREFLDLGIMICTGNRRYLTAFGKRQLPQFLAAYFAIFIGHLSPRTGLYTAAHIDSRPPLTTAFGLGARVVFFFSSALLAVARSFHMGISNRTGSNMLIAPE